MPIKEISRPAPRYVRLEGARRVVHEGRPMAAIAGFWVINVDDPVLNRRLLPTAAVLPVAGRGEPVYVGNSRSSPRHGAQAVGPGEILPVFIN